MCLKTPLEAARSLLRWARETTTPRWVRALAYLAASRLPSLSRSVMMTTVFEFASLDSDPLAAAMLTIRPLYPTSLMARTSLAPSTRTTHPSAPNRFNSITNLLRNSANSANLLTEVFRSSTCTMDLPRGLAKNVASPRLARSLAAQMSRRGLNLQTTELPHGRIRRRKDR